MTQMFEPSQPERAMISAFVVVSVCWLCAIILWPWIGGKVVPWVAYVAIFGSMLIVAIRHRRRRRKGNQD